VAARPDAVVRLDAGGTPRITAEADPMATVLTSLVEAFGPLSHRLPVAFRRSMASTARNVDIPRLLQLVLLEPLQTSDFLFPVEAAKAASFADRLEQVRATRLPDLAVDLIRYRPADLGVVRQWAHDPDRLLADYCSKLADYWRAVVQPAHPRLEDRLRREAERLELGLQEYGQEIVLNLVHPRLQYADGCLRMSDNLYRGPTPWHAEMLVIKPMIAAPNTLMTNMGTVDPPHISRAYFATAPPALRPGWPADSRADDGDALVLLVGRPRAHILRSLQRRPGTTTDLADEFGLTPGTVSHHLKLLQQARVVIPLRRGAMVYYRITDRGARLVSL
jgi:DNA-binding transcriptional ArsR family regulator